MWCHFLLFAFVVILGIALTGIFLLSFEQSVSFQRNLWLILAIALSCLFKCILKLSNVFGTITWSTNVSISCLVSFTWDARPSSYLIDAIVAFSFSLNALQWLISCSNRWTCRSKQLGVVLRHCMSPPNWLMIICVILTKYFHYGYFILSALFQIDSGAVHLAISRTEWNV